MRRIFHLIYDRKYRRRHKMALKLSESEEEFRKQVNDQVKFIEELIDKKFANKEFRFGDKGQLIIKTSNDFLRNINLTHKFYREVRTSLENTYKKAGWESIEILGDATIILWPL